MASSSTGHYEERLIKKRSKVSRRELETLNDNNSKRARRDLPKCPICEYRIEPNYWADHYQYELSRLSDPTSEAFNDPSNKTKGKRGAAVMAKKQLESKGKKKVQSVHEETLDRIQKNRTKRNDRLKHLEGPHMTEDDSQVALQMMQEEAAAVQGGDVQTCFICNEQLFGDLDAVNLHIDNCLSNQTQQQEEDEDDEIIDADDDEPAAGTTSTGWEEYEWAGQRRVRATAMMEGGYGGAGFTTASKVEVDDDEDIDLDVEDDDAAQYGESQYTERDIVVQMDDENDSTLREMVSGGVARTSNNNSSERRQGFEETVSVTGWNTHLKEESSSSTTAAGHSSLVIESLKSRIRELERTSRSNNCLICLEPYKTPLTSIVCWHVHCEQCWLQTLGTKKLCPQCQKITAPSDLRRIYL